MADGLGVPESECKFTPLYQECLPSDDGSRCFGISLTHLNAASLKPNGNRWQVARPDITGNSQFLILSPDGKTVVAGIGMRLFIYDAATGRLLHKQAENDELEAMSAQFSADGKRLVLAGSMRSKNLMSIVDATTFKELDRMEFASDKHNCLKCAASDDLAVVAVACYTTKWEDNTPPPVLCWYPKIRRVRRFGGPFEACSVNVSRDGNRLLVFHYYGFAEAIDMLTGKVLWRYDANVKSGDVPIKCRRIVCE